MTTLFPLSGFVITISLFFLRFRKMQCWRSIRGEGLKVRISKIQEMRFYLELLRNKQGIFSKVVKISDFRILSGWIEKYKPVLSKSDSSWDNSYCMRLVIVLLAVNIGKLQSLVSEDNFFCWVYNDFCSDFLLCDVIDFVRM